MKRMKWSLSNGKHDSIRTTRTFVFAPMTIEGGNLPCSILFISLFVGFVLNLNAQVTATDAALLQQEALEALNNKPLRAFDRLQALEKLQHRLKIVQELDSFSTPSPQADSLLKDLKRYFADHSNPDSLLATTRFYPDSIFQTDTRYSATFRATLQQYLSAREEKVRKAFLHFRYLNHSPFPRNSYQLTYNNYWALEVLELDTWLDRQEQTYQNLPSTTRNTLIDAQLKNQLDSLRYDKLSETYRQKIDQLQQSADQMLLQNQALEQKNLNLKYIGLCGLAAILLLVYLFGRRAYRVLFANYQSVLEEKKRSEDLLSNMLPSEVLRQLKNNKVVKAQLYESVCILFTDFQHFSKISKNLPPQELVRELDYCFSAFDQIIEKHHLQKIKTIGDAYMCVGGLYTKGDKHAQRIVAAGLEIQEFLRYRSAQKEELGGYFFEARIGIHTGSVVAGVVGTKRIAFDVWGDSVNIAQQMEQCGEVRHVNISSATYELVKDHYDCTYRGEVEVKNGKQYGMYRVNG